MCVCVRFFLSVLFDDESLVQFNHTVCAVCCAVKKLIGEYTCNMYAQCAFMNTNIFTTIIVDYSYFHILTDCDAGRTMPKIAQLQTPFLTFENHLRFFRV